MNPVAVRSLIRRSRSEAEQASPNLYTHTVQFWWEIQVHFIHFWYISPSDLYIIRGEVNSSKAQLSLSLNISFVWNFSNDVDDGATRLKWGSPQEVEWVSHWDSFGAWRVATCFCPALSDLLIFTLFSSALTLSQFDHRFRSQALQLRNNLYSYLMSHSGLTSVHVLI